MQPSPRATHRVSIGMPVFDAQRYLSEAIDSLLGQSYTDFELIISDNASRDETEEICRKYAREDDRIYYVRNPENRGYIENFNDVFRLSKGEYFKWAAYDDICLPDFLLRCVEALDHDPTAVLAYPAPKGIDQDGAPISLSFKDRELVERPLDYTETYEPDSMYSPDPIDRFTTMMERFWWSDHLYGLIRSDALRRTRLHAHHYMSDHMLLTELSLYGRFLILPESLWLLRVHPEQTSRTSTLRTRTAKVETDDLSAGPRGWWKMLGSYPKRLSWYLRALERAPIDRRQKLRGYGAVLRAVLWWLLSRARQLNT